MSKMDQFYRRGSKTMAGTEGTNEYQVQLDTALGGVGVRMLRNGAARIRVEPTSAEAAAQIAKVLESEWGWKQPGDGGENRFSFYYQDVFGSEIIDGVCTGGFTGAVRALTSDGNVPVVRRGAPSYVRSMVSKHHLLGKARTHQLPGVNRRWSRSALLRKVSAA